MGSRRVFRFLLGLLVAVALFSLWRPAIFFGQTHVPVNSREQAIHRHVIDRAGVIPAQDLPRFEQYMSAIMRESGIDIRFVFLQNTGTHDIATLAAETMDRLQIGGRTGQQRGVLLLYDMQGRRLKVEVGYGLEGWFPDAFVSYLVRDHARMFFASTDLSLGLRQLLRLLQHRIREAVIGNDFDPRVLGRLMPLSHMSGGAGVNAKLDSDAREDIASPGPSSYPRSYPAGETPAETYSRYLDWLSQWPLIREADLITPDSGSYLSSFRVSPAYSEFILMGEFGKSFRIVERGDLALLYFTDTPFVSPHFFVREDGRWRMDLVAEVRNTREQVGGEYTWAYRGEGDRYTAAFSDLLVSMKGYRRFRDGDNRPLLIRGDG